MSAASAESSHLPLTRAEEVALREAVIWHDGKAVGLDLRAVDRLVTVRTASALRQAGVKVAKMRHTVSGRRVANAEWLGEVVYAMGDDVIYQAKRRGLRDVTTPSGEPS